MHRISRGALAAAFALSASVAVASAQTKLLHYNFDEASSGTTPAVDHGTGTPAPGTFAGDGTRTGNTPAGYSLGAFDATVDGDGHVTAGDADKLDGLGAMTLAGWVNLQAAPGHGNRIMSKQVASGNFDGFSFGFNNPNDGTIAANDFALNIALGGTSGFGFYRSANDFSADNEWLFVAMSYDGAGNVTFYTGDETNSVSSSAGALLAGSNPGTLVANDRDFKVAAQSEGTLSPPALFDDIRVYGSALSSTELDAIRLANIPEPTSIAAFGAMGLLALRRRRA